MIEEQLVRVLEEKEKRETLNDQESMEIELATEHATEVDVLVDDQNDGDPSTYDLEFKHWSQERGEYLQWSNQTGETARSWQDTEPSTKTKVILTNTSGAQADYGLVVIAKRA